MKLAALFVNPHADEETLIRVQSQLLGFFVTGNWGIIIPAAPCPATWQIVETCTQLKRHITTVGLHKAGECTGKYYQTAAIPLCQSRKFINQYRDYAEWERDNWIISQADLVICYDMPDIQERVPRIKRGVYFKPLIDHPGSSDADFYLAHTIGLGKLLVERLLVA